MIFFQLTITAAGTPQQLSKSTNPGLPSVNINGVQYAAGSAATGFKQLVIQNPPGTTGNLYVGGPALVKGTLVNVGAVLIPGASLTLGQWGCDGLLDDIWVDTDTSGNKAIVCLQ